MRLLWRLARWVRTWRLIYWVFRRAPGSTVTVARPTTSDGETCQITTTVPVGATAMEIGDAIETLSLAVQARVIRQNEILMKTNVEVAHTKWLKISKKLEEADRNGRHGLGVLSKEERLWWMLHKEEFDAEGPLSVADVAKAARDPQSEG